MNRTIPEGAAVTDPTTNEYFYVNHERKLKSRVQPYNLHPNFDPDPVEAFEWHLKCGGCRTVLAVKKGTKKFRCAVCNTVAEIPAQAAASQWGPLLQEGATAVEFINSPWSFLDATLDVISETVDEATDVLSSAPTMAARGVEMGVKELPLPGKKGEEKGTRGQRSDAWGDGEPYGTYGQGYYYEYNPNFQNCIDAHDMNAEKDCEAHYRDNGNVGYHYAPLPHTNSINTHTHTHTHPHQRRTVIESELC